MDAASLERLPPAMIVVADSEIADELSGALAFIGLRCEVVPPDSIAEHADAGDRWSAVMLCDGVGGPALKMLDGWHDGPPVIAVGLGQPIPERLKSLHARLLGRVERPLRHAQLVPLLGKLARHKPAAQRDVELFRSLVGKSEPVQNIRRMIQRVAPTDSTVLLLGETGTGKEVAARHIHYHSQRRDGPFVAVNCGAIPADLLESELFGHEKGAFTGALTARKGRFELAENGTLFLDEIGDMSLQMQVKLLRVLQERQFERLGSGRPMPANVRIVCATHRNLESMVEEGTFRGDLYYRINVFPIEMPALRERREDLPLLAAELVARLEAEGRGAVSFTQDALAAMARHDWPGNVRELANLVERLAILHPGAPVGAQDLPPHIRAHARTGDAGAPPAGFMTPTVERAAPPAPAQAQAEVPAEAEEPDFGPGRGLKDYLNDIEEQLIRRALAESGGIVADAAKSLGMRRTTLVEKLRKFGIDRLGFATET
ncbi:MAG TPA: sigma-54 dependent transcriptional regulator [Gammaproteobacteria bacterium]|nr:sigma-54 dependent transcriptional regulator [Gammaproteobacteria bacterium]HRP86781.1 sigma-54 dependent transcriptional regulator [Gammaproteobacteria bacterium]